jgi:hypothetical protein
MIPFINETVKLSTFHICLDMTIHMPNINLLHSSCSNSKKYLVSIHTFTNFGLYIDL